jgi:hypothetical protein
VDEVRHLWTLRLEHPRLPDGAIEATTDIRPEWIRLEQGRDLLASFVGQAPA